MSADDASPYSNLVRAQVEDPFATATQSFADDPFAQPNNSESSPSDDGQSSRRDSVMDNSGLEPQPGGPEQAYLEGRRGSMVFIPHTSRSTTDPIVDDGYPVDSEFTGQGSQQHDGYDFEQPHPPAFTRTFSAPLPQRVGFLRHPHTPNPVLGYNDHPRSRENSISSIHSVISPPGSSVPTARPFVSTYPSSSESGSSERLRTPLETVSLELADGLQSAIQTLLHLSPPHLLDNAKEQYSGCTVQVPSTSLSALMSSMRGLNYLSANARALCEDVVSHAEDSMFGLSNKKEDFDIGELLQSVADLLCGQAAQAGVDFVLFHGDVGIKHVSVNGSAEGLAYALGHVSQLSVTVILISGCASSPPRCSAR
jgi:osomolarity two-component system response regulator SSK1